MSLGRQIGSELVKLIHQLGRCWGWELRRLDVSSRQRGCVLDRYFNAWRLSAWRLNGWRRAAFFSRGVDWLRRDGRRGKPAVEVMHRTVEPGRHRRRFGHERRDVVPVALLAWRSQQGIHFGAATCLRRKGFFCSFGAKTGHQRVTGRRREGSKRMALFWPN